MTSAPAALRLGIGRLSLALLALVPLSGCSIQQMAADSMVPVFVKAKDDLNTITETRYARAAGPGMLLTLDSFVQASPTNAELRLLQAEMHASFAFGFLEPDEPEWATFHYQRAREAACVALAKHDAELADSLETLSPDAIRAAFAGLSAKKQEKVVPGAFWWAFARGAEVNLHRDDPAQVAALTRVDAVMGWVLEQDETFYNAGPHLYFAMRHTALPKSLGGDPSIGLEHFEAVDRLTEGKMLMAKVFRAQFHSPGLAATAAGASIDEVLAAQQCAWDTWFGILDGVANAPADLWPEQALPNEVAKERARAMLADPESHNIIPPKGAQNPYAESAAGGDWGGSGGGGGDWGGSGDGGGDWGSSDGDWGSGGDWGE